MLSQLAQWQQSRKVFFLLAPHQQWQEKFQRSLFRGLFKILAVFQVMNTPGQTAPSGRRHRAAGDAPAEFTRWGLPSPVCPRPTSSPHQAPGGDAPSGTPAPTRLETGARRRWDAPGLPGIAPCSPRLSRGSVPPVPPFCFGCPFPFNGVFPSFAPAPPPCASASRCCCGNLPACSGGAVPWDPQPVKPEVCSHGVTAPRPHRHLPPPFSAEDDPGFGQTPFLRQRREGEGWRSRRPRSRRAEPPNYTLAETPRGLLLPSNRP